MAIMVVRMRVVGIGGASPRVLFRKYVLYARRNVAGRLHLAMK